ncbi:MAG: hypothetical protein ACOZFS_04760 [Thermodesulfobacteriota bacterium]
MTESREINRACRLALKGLGLLIFFILLGSLPIPLAAQEQTVTLQPYQRPGQATTTTREEKVQPDGTKTSKETMATESQGSNYKYSGLPGKFIRQGGQTRSQGEVKPDREPRNGYSINFECASFPSSSDPTKAYWFERRDGKLMIIDPYMTQKYSRNPN